jgi:hypothetical protein
VLKGAGAQGCTLRRSCILVALVTCTLSAPSARAAETRRTVYVTVTDRNGAPAADLSPADFVVKEGGKERQVTDAQPASAVPMWLTLAVEERLIVDGSTRLALWGFMKRIAGRAAIRLVTIGLRNETAVDYTGDLNALVGAINKLTLNPNRDSNVAEGIFEIAERLTERRPRRPVIVVVAVTGGQSGVEAQAVLDKIRDSAATMFAVTVSGIDNAAPLEALADQSGREQILGDGPKQSGGRRVDVRTTSAFPGALQQVASDLLAQYAITYVLPDGVRPERRLSVTVKRPGITVRSPSLIPDR